MYYCPKCGQEADARPNNRCYCNYCGYEGIRNKLKEKNESKVKKKEGIW